MQPFRTTRTRSTDMRSNTYRTLKEDVTYPVSHTSVRQYTNKSGTLKSIQDNNNHNFKKLRADGAVIMSDCCVSEWERTYTGGSLTATSGNWTGLITDDCTGSISGMPALPPNLSVDQFALLLRAYGKMNESAILSGELLSDLGKTVSMLKRPFKGVRELLTRMVKYRAPRIGKTVASATKASANAWLEYRYGWKPLILDANSIIKESHKVREKCKMLRLVARAGMSDSLKTNGSWSATAQQKCSGSYTLERSIRCGVGVLYDLKPRTTSEQVNQVLGTRPRDLALTAWEVVPYSFVVDWFLPIGPWLEAVLPEPNITVRGHWRTSVTERSLTRSGSLIKYASSDWHGSCGSDTEKSVTYVRSVNDPIPNPIAAVAKKLSGIHAIDAVALMVKPIMAGLKTFRH